MNLQEATKLGIQNNKAFYELNPELLMNGTEDIWRSYDWMKQQRLNKKSVSKIAESAGCSYHTIKKWLRIHKLQFDHSTEGPFRKGHTPFNKGKHYSLNLSDEQKRLKSEISKKVIKRGKDCHFWRGGITSERALIGIWTTSVAADVHKKYNYICQICEKPAPKLHAHHVLPVASHPQWAYEFNNLITVCEKCHKILHGQQSSTQKIGAEKRIGKQKLVGEYIKIKNIKYLGKKEVYDLSVKGDYHNYVANGFVVHNSFRYTQAEEDQFYVPQIWRLQDTKNKQGSLGELDATESKIITDKLKMFYELAYNLYEEALEKGVAREEARLFLPGFSIYSQWVICCDLRNWLHFCGLRMDEHAQWEIRQFANCLYENIIEPNFKWTCEAWELYEKPI